MAVNFSLINEIDELQDIFSKYGALALEKQGNLARIVGDAEPELDIEQGIVKFGDLTFPIQLIGYLNPNEFQWSWAWDNDEIGFPDELIVEAKEIKEFGQEYNISQFIEPMFSSGIDEAHILSMTVSSIFDNDAYCAVNYGNFIFFVTVKGDNISSINDTDEFVNVFNDFHRKFEVTHKIALESYAALKGYEYKEKKDFSLVKIGEDRVIVGFSERGNVNNIKPIKP